MFSRPCPRGNYRLKAEQPGFKTFVQSGIALEVDQRADLNITLEIGEISETITVAGEPPLVRTQDTTLGGVVENRRILEMPLNGRFFLDLANLIPGTVSSTIPAPFWPKGRPPARLPSTPVVAVFWRGPTDEGTSRGRQLITADRVRTQNLLLTFGSN